MRIAILETIVMPAGHEVEFDRILVEELKKQDHEPCFFVPQNFPFKIDYHVPVEYLQGGEAVSYAGVNKMTKIWLSIVREKRRVNWYDSAFAKANDGRCDAIIVPTNRWRVMRSIRKSLIRKSPVPVLFMMHGIMPSDRKTFIDGVKSLRDYKNIHIGALGMQTEFPELRDCPNFHTILPPVYVPMDLQITPEFHFHEPLRLGFFGQYRKEKNLEFFLQAFTQAKFTQAVQLTVQGATATTEDSDDFDRLAQKYAGYNNIVFLHKNLLGIEWQQELMKSDVVLIPYGAERYRYQPSAMLFTAIGYFKPVLQSPEMSPEILQEFKIGEAVKLESVETFSRQLEIFVNTFKAQADKYKSGLVGANLKYSQANLLKRILQILQVKDANSAGIGLKEAHVLKQVAVLESIVMPAGHEIEFDRLLLDELKHQGYNPRLFVPAHFPFKIDYQVPVDYLRGGEAISYAGVGKAKKLWLSYQREKRRVEWFDDACRKAQSGLSDAIIIPTATYRYLRTLQKSDLRNSPVPVYFLFHGINAGEKAKFISQAQACQAYKNIHLKIITLRNDFANCDLTNLELIKPTVYQPKDLPLQKDLRFQPPIKIGFFGQFRKEKNLGFLLEAFKKAKFKVPVRLIVQGSTAKPEDGALFEALAKKYDANANMTFLHANLIGLEWEKALSDVDAVMLLYGAERYRYHWAAMLFTAIGYYKPVLVSPVVNPEVLAKFKIGRTVDAETEAELTAQLENFVQDLVTNTDIYRTNLAAANAEYSQVNLIKNILR